MHRAGEADRAGAHAVGGQVQGRHDGAAAAADRPIGRQWVGLGRDAPGHRWRARTRDQGAVAAEQHLAQGGQGVTLLGDGLGDAVGRPEVDTERQVDHTVGPRGAGPQGVQVGELSPQGFGAGRLEGRRRLVGAGEGEDGVAVTEQLGDDGGADEAVATGDEYVHGSLLTSDGIVVPS